MNRLVDSASRRPRKRVSLGLAAVGFVLFVLVFFPGYVSFDVVNQLEQGRTGSFTNVSPPANALLLGAAFAMSESTAPLFLLNSILLFTSAAWILVILRPKIGHAFLVLAAVPLLPILPHLWTDVHLTAVLSMATALILYASQAGHQRRRRRAWLAAFFLLCWATWVRHNAIIAVLPLALLPIAQMLVIERKPRKNTVALLMAVAAVVALILIRSASSWLVDRPVSVWAVTPMWDLQTLSIHADEVLLPDGFVGPGMSTDELQQAFSPNTAVPLFTNTRSGVLNPTLELLGPAKRQRLLEAWLHAVRGSPLAWMEHRWTVFHRLFGPHTRDDLVYMVDSPRFLEPDIRSPWRAELHAVVRLPLEWARDLGLFAPWPGFVIALGVFMVGRRQGPGVSAALQVALLASATLYVATLLPLTPSAEQRYLLWPLLAVIMAAALALGKPLQAPEE